MVSVGRHPNITLMSYSEVEQVNGYVGNFSVTVRRKPRYVDEQLCNGCGTCSEKCPGKKIPSEFELGLGVRPAIYTPFAQAVPRIPVIDTVNCAYFKTGKCRACEKFCPRQAIDFEQKEQHIEVDVGAIILATGFHDFDPRQAAQYGYGRLDNVVTGMEMERLINSGGPTNGKVFLKNGGRPQRIAILHCVGSRGEQHEYCSRVCCMYLAKQALLYKHAVPDGQAYIFYIDTRSTGKGYEEFIQRVVGEGVLYLRGKVSKIFRDGDKIRVFGADTLSGKRVEIAADLVVLGMAIMPSEGTKELLNKLGVTADDTGFVLENHAKFRPLETGTEGIFVAGMAQGPKDIPDSVAQGSGAASKVLTLFAQGERSKAAVGV